ncbi:MAG: gfo/Idh/MocA family oxidoreductase [Thermotoga sp.]|nr:MAG: gfo/Idh/MocA family oxidoreductase [Thermotoga sp.]
MKIGFISAAHVHTSAYVRVVKADSNFEPIGLYDEDVKRGKGFSAEHDIEFFNDVDELLSNVDCVVITSENVNHKKDVLKAAEHGIPILCEKPLSTNVEDAEVMLSTCKGEKVPLYSAFPVRFHPAIADLIQRLNRKEIGKIRMIVTTNRGQIPPGWFIDPLLSGGGSIMDHVVHVVDLLRYVLKSEFGEVLAFKGKNIHPDIEVEDNALLDLKMKGIPVTLDCSWSRPKSWPIWGDLTMRIVGEEGVIDVDLFSQNIIDYSNKTERIHMIDWGEDLDRLMLRAFYQELIGKKTILATGEDGLKAIEVVEAAYESIKRNERVLLR